MRIENFSGGVNNPSLERPTEKTEEKNPSFWEGIKEKIKEVDNYQHKADTAMEEGAIRGAENIHEAMIKLQEAEISLRFLLTVRNKALQAYKEIMRMQF